MSAPVIPVGELVAYAFWRNDLDVINHYIPRSLGMFDLKITFPYPHRNCYCELCKEFVEKCKDSDELITRDPSIPYVCIDGLDSIHSFVYNEDSSYSDDSSEYDESSEYSEEAWLKDATDGDLASFSTVNGYISCPLCFEDVGSSLSMDCCKQCICQPCVRRLMTPNCPYCRADLRKKHC